MVLQLNPFDYTHQSTLLVQCYIPIRFRYSNIIFTNILKFIWYCYVNVYIMLSYPIVDFLITPQLLGHHLGHQLITFIGVLPHLTLNIFISNLSSSIKDLTISRECATHIHYECKTLVTKHNGLYIFFLFCIYHTFIELIQFPIDLF